MEVAVAVGVAEEVAVAAGVAEAAAGAGVAVGSSPPQATISRARVNRTKTRELNL
jgi:hypothetical protein